MQFKMAILDASTPLRSFIEKVPFSSIADFGFHRVANNNSKNDEEYVKKLLHSQNDILSARKTTRFGSYNHYRV